MKSLENVNKQKDDFVRLYTQVHGNIKFSVYIKFIYYA